MVLALDIGNTNIAMGAVEDGQVVFLCHLATDKTRSADEYAALFQLITAQRGFTLSSCDGAIICSVVPQLTPVMREAVRLSAGINALVVGPGVKTGLNIRIDDPSELGSDFVAAAVSAVSTYPLPCITIDMGTATSLGVLDKTGAHIGVVICPGVTVSQEALAAGTSQLPHVGTDAPPRVIGRSTEASMKSGLVHGTAAMLDGLIERIEEELGERASVVASGDLAEGIIPHCRRKDIVVDNELLMRGLWMIFNKNKR